MSDVTFELDPRLAASTRPVKTVDGIQWLLANDSRWPWLLLVPEVPGAVELDDLPPAVQSMMMRQASSLAGAMRAATGAGKTNVATIGNVVPQFHLHIIGRRAGDPNWPAPVWGFGEAQPYGDGEADALTTRIQAALAEAGA